MKIAIVVQRYGPDINGGAEQHARWLATQLATRHQVTVLTTRSKSYIKWDNDIDKKEEIIGGIQVKRFSSLPGNRKKFRFYKKLLNQTAKCYRLFRHLGWHSLASMKIWKTSGWFKRWLRHQGPYCPSLIEYIKSNKNHYDIFIFFTYLYYPTNAGLPEAASKSILIPTAHPEKPFYYPGYEHIFARAGFIMYNTLAEKRLSETIHPLSQTRPNDVAGIGMDPQRFNPGPRPLEDPYFVYIGRIDRSKNVHELIRFFQTFHPGRKVKLVLIGKAEKFDIPGDSRIVFTGFVSEEEKNNWLYHSHALIIPSKFESLSMVTLEAMQMGIPVVANRKSEVLRDHIRLSEAGFDYANRKEFHQALIRLLQMPLEERNQLAENGKKYVEKNYRTGIIMNKFDKAFKLLHQKHYDKIPEGKSS